MYYYVVEAKEYLANLSIFIQSDASLSPGSFVYRTNQMRSLNTLALVDLNFFSSKMNRNGISTISLLGESVEFSYPTTLESAFLKLH
jgi:hypothetical protein